MGASAGVGKCAVFAGEFPGEEYLRALVGPSYFITANAPTQFRADVERLGWDVERAVRQTDLSGIMEGLYVKVEDDGAVTERYRDVSRSGSRRRDRSPAFCTAPNAASTAQNAAGTAHEFQS